MTDGACLLHVIPPDNTDTHVAFIPDGAKTYFAACDGPATATAEYPKICPRGSGELDMHALWIACVLASACGNKPDLEPIKKQALAIREKSRPCQDVECANKAVAELADLTTDLTKFADADSKFIGEMRLAVGKRELELKYAPPRTKGFSIVLPAGWETRQQEGVDFTAVKTSSRENLVSFVVVRGPKDVAFETEAACESA